MISINELTNKVKEIANKYPNNIYKPEGKSSYFRGTNSDCPMSGCIFGISLTMLEVDINGLDSQPICSALDKLNIKYNTKQIDWCRSVQLCQDRGRSWSTAIQSAEWAL